MTEQPDDAVLPSPDITVLGMDFRFVTEQVSESVEWSILQPHHTLLVWRRGRVASKEFEFEGGRSGRFVPRASNTLVVPAGLRSAGCVHKGTCEFVEITVPVAAVGNVTLRPAIDQLDPLLLSLVDRIATVAGRADVPARLLRESIAETLRLHIRDRYGEAPPAQPGRAARAFDDKEQRRLVEFLQDSLDADVDIASLAKVVGMNTHDFRPAFTRTFHTTPHQFVLDQRVARAKMLLATTALSVSEIGVAVGFSTPSHFATAFKQRVNVPPSVYRRNA
jgi:AraC family transcriptional regulator